MKIAIIRFSSIGDIVLTTPVVRALKQQLPLAEIHFITKKENEVLVKNNPYIDRYFLLESSLFLLIKQLKIENYDFIIDLHTNLRTGILKQFLGKTSYSFSKLNFRKFLLTFLKINILPDIHIVDRYFKTVQKLGVKNDNLGLDYFIPREKESVLEDLPDTHTQYVAVVIGAHHETKKLPPNRLIELCEKIDSPIVLLGGKTDQDTAQKIVNTLGTKVWNAVGRYDLDCSAVFLKYATKVYTHDTGLMHIAAALKKNIISIWGNTVPEFGMYPYKTAFEIWEVKNLDCRPCSKIGFTQCPKGHFRCMNDIIFTSKKN